MIGTDIFSSAAYSMAWEEFLRIYDTADTRGLNETEVENRIRKFGPNSIKPGKKKSLWLVFLGQFNSGLVYLLIFAAGLSFFFQEWLDGSAIVVVIWINAIIGFYMEYQAGRSMDALKRLSTLPAKVIRDGTIREIDSEGLAPGDLIFLEAGDMVPADARIARASQLQVDESALTGESVPVDKEAGQIKEDTIIAERTNMLYKGTFVTKGNTYGIITATGMLTELGKIADLVQSAEQAATPLEKKLGQFSIKLMRITVGLVIIIFFGGILNGQQVIEMLETSIALAVAAVPEGLPVVATLALAKGMMRMAGYNVIVKKLSAVETLGGTNVICTDKTGTLTQNKIEVNLVVTPAAKYDVAKPQKGDFGDEAFQRLVQGAVLCNTASMDDRGTDTGDPLEVGLLKFAVAQESEIDSLRKQMPTIREEPFSSETKIMATLHREGNGRQVVYAKGAPEELLQRCSRVLNVATENEFTDVLKKDWLTESETLSGSGLRVIGAAFRKGDPVGKALSVDLTFLGLIGMIDPPRHEVYEAIRECRNAGIKLIMITGDHPSTARNIGLKLGIIGDDKEAVMVGKEMNEYERLADAEKDRWIHTAVFARVSPQQKLDLVSVLQERKYVVGMTGDGVNDAPALKKADIGIAMGLRGTQVAQEVADMVLKDDSFSSIVQAIRQGRIIFDNIRKFVIFLLSCNMSELFVIATAAILNLHFQLFPLQILYINLVTDVLPALALGVTAGSASIMRQPPRNPQEPIIDRPRWTAIIFYAVVITLTTLAAVFISHFILHRAETWNPQLCNNILFFTLLVSQILHVFNMNASGSAFFKSEVARNEYVWYAVAACIVFLVASSQVVVIREALHIYRMSVQDWSISVGMSFLSLVIIQASRTLKLITQ